MARGYWLIKSEPFKYSWDQLVADGSTYWNGVRNYEARNNLAAMRRGDLALYYHSNEGKEVVGVKQIKADPVLADINLVRRGRLSVVPIERLEFQHILSLGETKLPRGKRAPAALPGSNSADE